MRQRGGRRKVRRAGADRGCNGHHAATLHLLGIGDGHMGHALFIVATERRQLVTNAIKCLAKPGHIAMAEDGPDTGKGRLTSAIELLYALCRHPACQRL